ncbi:MAG TPA: FecR domain-containing protein [Caulobacteraceae bacterium]|nr:FecR domain-containing protein [Caulobacteraceae bacterium]
MNRPVPDIENGDQSPRAVATAWFSRQRSGEMTKADQAALREWLDADPAHLDAYRAVRGAWVDLAAVRAHPQVIAMREDMGGARERRRRLLALRALAACFVAGVFILAGAAGWRWLSGPRPLADHTFATALGEQATITLPDGSQLTLNTDTVVRTRADADRRLVYLDRGQMYVKVAKDPRHPFIVTAGDRTITALGTAFDVRLEKGLFEVTLVEGKVRVEAAVPAGEAPGAAAGARRPAVEVQATEMTAGSQLVAPDNGEWRLARTNVALETSWTRGQLIFDDVPLKDVVAELNRYSSRKMVVAGESLQSTPISGNFKPGDVAGFVYAVESFGLARSAPSADGTIELRPIS